MHDLLDRRILTSLIAITLMQSAIVMPSYGITVVVPDAAGDIGIRPEWVGYLFATIYATASLSGVLSGRMIAAWGAAGAYRLMMAAIALGALALMGATPLLAFLSAALLGLATGPMNPVGSHVLARISPPGWAAFIFSVKQCATPGGGALAGILFPSLVLIWGWQNAFLIIPVAAVLFLLAIQFCGLDDDTEITVNEPDPSQAGGAFESLRLSLATRRIAATSMACMFFAGSQVALIAFLVVYLWQIGVMSVAQAGMAFSLFHASGVAARLVFGWFAERRISSFALLVFSACGMAVSLIALASFSTEWSLRAMFAVIAFAGHRQRLGRLALRGARALGARRKDRRCDRRCAGFYVCGCFRDTARLQRRPGPHGRRLRRCLCDSDVFGRGCRCTARMGPARHRLG